MTFRSSGRDPRKSWRPPVMEGNSRATRLLAADDLRDANPWQPMTRLIDVAHLGKLIEELGECAAAVICCIIYGVSHRAPETDKPIREGLEDEVADVLSNIELASLHFGLRDQTSRAFDFNYGTYLEHFGRSLSCCSVAVARCIIQGIDECEPVTGRSNREWLEETIAGVRAGVALVADDMGFCDQRIAARKSKKMAHLRQWHSMLDPKVTS